MSHVATTVQQRLGVHANSPGVWLDVWIALELVSKLPEPEGEYLTAVEASLAALHNAGIERGSVAYSRIERQLSALHSKLLTENDLRQQQRERQANGR